MKTKIKMILLLSIIAVMIILFSNTVQAKQITLDEFDFYAEYFVVNTYNEKGENVDTVIPESGGGIGPVINTNKSYTNCYFELWSQNNYGDTIELDYGTFTLKEIEENEENVTKTYIYTCPVNTEKANEMIKNNSGHQNYVSTLENKDTGISKDVYYQTHFYNLELKETSNLSINGEYIIKNGKYIDGEYTDGQGVYGKDSVYAVYREVYNTVSIEGKDVEVYYSDMGSNFKIELFEESTANITSENTNTGITLKSTITDSNEEHKTVELVVDKVTSGEDYNTVTEVLKDKVEKFVVYDITLESAGAAVQPNGKVKLSIPIPDGYDTSKLLVYRVGEDGTKTEYDVNIETINNIKYAVFETDHFSTYVLAQEKVEVKEPEKDDTTTTTPEQDKEDTITTPDTEKEDTTVTTPDNNTNNTNKDDDKLDETPKTGNIEFVSIISMIALISLVGIVVLNKKK